MDLSLHLESQLGDVTSSEAEVPLSSASTPVFISLPVSGGYFSGPHCTVSL